MGVYNYLCFVVACKEFYLRSNVLTFLVYCGEKTCAYNNKGKCRNFKIALNEQGMCMGYAPLIMPNINSNVNTESITMNSNPVGFSG